MQTKDNNTGEPTGAEMYFAINRQRKTAVELPGFGCFEEVQCAFRFGIQMPDGPANGVGRCKDRADFLARAKSGGWVVLRVNEPARDVQWGIGGDHKLFTVVTAEDITHNESCPICNGSGQTDDGCACNRCGFE